MTSTFRAELIDGDGDAHPLDLLTATLSYDQTRAPHVQADLTCAMPTEPTLAQLDPRLPRRVRVYAGDRAAMRMMGDLGLRSRSVTRPDDTLTITAASDEALVMDDGDHYSTASITYASHLLAIIDQVEGAVGDVTWDMGTNAPGEVTLELNGANRWALIDDIADRAGNLDVWDDGTRTWHVAERATTATADPTHAFRVGTNATITQSEARIIRSGDGFYNRVQLVYRWRDSNDAEHEVRARQEVDTGLFTATIGSRVTWHEERSISTTQTGAANAAASLLTRMVTRGRSYQITGTSNIDLRPGHTVDVALPTGPQERHLVQSVTFDLSEGTMTATLRIPDSQITMTGGPA